MQMTKTIRAPIVERLFKKSAPGVPVESVETLHLIAGEGIEADVARSEVSPRQVLIVRKEDVDGFCLPEGYLRENLIISGVPAEEFQPGNRIRFEGGAIVHLTFHCEPCKSIAGRILNLKSIIGRRGVLGVVTQTGRLAVGSRLECEKSALSAMPSNPAQRACKVIARIPKGKVLDYATLLQAAGLQRVYFRAIPNYLKAAKALGLPTYRVVTSRFSIPKSEPEGSNRLAAELDLREIRKLSWVPKITHVLMAG
jgi:alkylated DNA nucleotide flippase Atl1